MAFRILVCLALVAAVAHSAEIKGDQAFYNNRPQTHLGPLKRDIACDYCKY